MKRATCMLVLSLCWLSLAGCGREQHADLAEFVKESDNLPRGRIPPLPEPGKMDPPQSFDAFDQPDPFYPKGQRPKIDEATSRDRSLLARYTHPGEIDAARKRARENLELAVKSAEFQVTSLRSAQEELRKRSEASKKDGKQPPDGLATELKDQEERLQAVEKELAARSQELASLDARFDADEKRYHELWRKK